MALKFGNMELNYLSMPSDETKFNKYVRCRCGMDVTKSSLRYHLTKSKKHALSLTDVRKWLSIKDGKANTTTFEEAWLAMSPEDIEEARANRERMEGVGVYELDEDGNGGEGVRTTGADEPAGDDAMPDQNCDSEDKFGKGELENVKLNDLKYDSVTCIQCGKDMKFMSVFHHFTKSRWHALSPAHVTKWRCVHDGRAQKKSLPSTTFRDAWVAREQAMLARDEDKGDVAIEDSGGAEERGAEEFPPPSDASLFAALFAAEDEGDVAIEDSQGAEKRGAEEFPPSSGVSLFAAPTPKFPPMRPPRALVDDKALPLDATKPKLDLEPSRPASSQSPSVAAAPAPKCPPMRPPQALVDDKALPLDAPEPMLELEPSRPASSQSPSVAAGAVATDHAPIQKPKLSDMALNYVLPSVEEMAKNMDRRRFLWPEVTKRHNIQLTRFKKWVDANTKSKGSATVYYGGATKFLDLFEFPETMTDIVDAFKAVYSEKLIEEALGLPILDPMIHWSRRIADGLAKLSTFVSLEAEDADDKAGMQCALMCQKRYVKPLRDKLSVEKDNQTERRKAIDRIRFNNLPPIPMQNQAAKDAMFDMTILHDHYLHMFLETGKIPRMVRRALNCKAYGVAAYRTFPGRGGEWERMTADQIRKAVEDGSIWYIIIVHHKTMKSSGPLGRLMPSDVKYAFKILLAFATPGKNLLFEPLGTAKNIQTSKMGIDFALAHTPGFQSPETTLMRKFTETIVGRKENAEKAAAMVKEVGSADASDQALKQAAKMSGHHSKTQKRFYNLDSEDPEEMAASSRAYINNFIGPVLLPPTEAELAAKKDRTAEVIMAEFKERVSKGDKLGDEDESSDESSDEEQDGALPAHVVAGVKPSISDAEVVAGANASLPHDEPVQAMVTKEQNDKYVMQLLITYLDKHGEQAAEAMRLKASNGGMQVKGTMISTELIQMALARWTDSREPTGFAGHRSITYNAKAHKFVKHDPSPNMISHPPRTPFRQTRITCKRRPACGDDAGASSVEKQKASDNASPSDAEKRKASDDAGPDSAKKRKAGGNTSPGEVEKRKASTDENPDSAKKKKGRKSPFSECPGAIAWILNRRAKWWHPRNLQEAPPLCELRSMLEDGIASGVFPNSINVENLRHVCRSPCSHEPSEQAAE